MHPSSDLNALETKSGIVYKQSFLPHIVIGNACRKTPDQRAIYVRLSTIIKGVFLPIGFCLGGRDGGEANFDFSGSPDFPLDCSVFDILSN